jgi:hypothetical protein
VLDEYPTPHKVHRFLDMPWTSNCCVEEADIAFHTGKHLEEVPRTFGGHLMCLKIPTGLEKRTDAYACSFKSGRGGIRTCKNPLLSRLCVFDSEV